MKKALLTLFVFICLMATIYSGYLLFTKEISAVAGSALLAIGILLSIWGITLAQRRKYRLKRGTFIMALVLIALFASATGAYAGYEPLAGAKDKLTNVFEGNEEEPGREEIELYAVPPAGMLGSWKQERLHTLKYWEGKDSKEITYKADKTPLVLNAGHKRTSQISVKFDVQVLKDISGLPPGITVSPFMRTSRTGVRAVTMEEKGKFTIQVEASGCEWWVRVGVEN